MITIIHGHGDQSAALYWIAAIVRASLRARDERGVQHLGECPATRLARDPWLGQHVVDSTSHLVSSSKFCA